MTDTKKIEEFVKHRDEVLKKPMDAEKTRVEQEDGKNQKIDLKPIEDDKDHFILSIDSKGYVIESPVAELFFDMLSGNRLLTKKVEELKQMINIHKIQTVPDGAQIIKPKGLI